MYISAAVLLNRYAVGIEKVMNSVFDNRNLSIFLAAFGINNVHRCL